MHSNGVFKFILQLPLKVKDKVIKCINIIII